MATDVDLSSQAMLSIGAESIESFQDGTTESEMAAKLYNDLRDYILSIYPWRFTVRKSTSLNKLIDAPENEFLFTYQLPNELTVLLKVLPAHVKYELGENQKLWTNYDGEIFVEYQYRPSEVRFPAYFNKMFVNYLASQFAIPITEDEGKAAYWQQQFELSFRRARLTDAKQRKGTGFKRFPITGVRG